MSATDELRRLLDERGVEYEINDRNGLRETIWCGAAAFQLSPTAKMTMIVTPEQAIAATLGSDREAELRAALNKAAGNWAKADDGLRKALDFMRIWISEDAHLGESEFSYELEKAEGLRKLEAIEQAIAAWNTRADYHGYEQAAVEAWEGIKEWNAQAIAATQGKSRWHELFGTPERAAETMALQCFGATSDACDTCVFGECDGKLRNSGTYLTVYDALLEWLCDAK